LSLFLQCTTWLLSLHWLIACPLKDVTKIKACKFEADCELMKIVSSSKSLQEIFLLWSKMHSFVRADHNRTKKSNRAMHFDF